MSNEHDGSGRIVNGTYASVGEMIGAGVNPTDSNFVAGLKLEQKKKSQAEHDEFFRDPNNFIHLGESVDYRSEYQKALDKANTQNAWRLGLIIAAAVILFLALNITVGAKIRDNTLYDRRDSYSFILSELNESSYVPPYSKDVTQMEVDRFVRRYGSLFKDGTPFVQMFNGCTKKYDCTRPTLKSVLAIQRHAIKPQTLLDDICTLEIKSKFEGARSGYTGPVDAKFVAHKDYGNNFCVTVNPDQLNALAGPLNVRYKLAIAGLVYLPSLLLLALLLLFVPKTPLPVKK